MLPAFYVLVALLCVAVAILFAMFGQLAARLPEFAPDRGGSRIAPLPELERGRKAPPLWRVPRSALWPTEDDAPTLYGILVLSTVCGSCTRLAAALPARVERTPPPAPVRIALSTPRRGDAEEFVAKHGLAPYEPLVDELGAWCRDNLGLSIAPALVVVRDQRIVEGFTVETPADVETVLSLAASPTPEPLASKISQ